MSILVLPKNIAEKIAAGEVVERPASVAKELVENAIDSGANSITVEIKNGGTTYIRVTDNGSGMSGDDAQKAFLRHATSKISAEEDLSSISTMGFRGEALYAISAVSEIELKTKEKHSEKGTQVNLSGGSESDIFEAATSDGTTIVVRNLFFNTPARMKFLKTNKTESAYIEDFVERIALSHPNIAFKLIIDNANKLTTNGSGDLNQVVYAIYGADYAKNLYNINYTYEGMTVTGVLGNSACFRSNRNFQTFFVNGRYVKSHIISHAVEEAHKSHIMVGKHPFFVLNLEIPYSEVDVNVHPAKTEVKFAKEQDVYKAIYWSAKSALETDDSPIEIEHIQPYSVKPTPITNPNFTPKPVKFAQTTFEIAVTPPTTSSMPTTPIIHTENSDFEIVDEIKSPVPEYLIVGQAFKTYIIIELNDELVLIDQHAAHERQIYEDLLTQGTINSQTLMSGITVTLTKPELASILENIAIFNELGFDIDQFGDNSLMVRATPLNLPTDTLKDILLEISDKVANNSQNLTPKIREDAIHTLACKSAIKGNRTLHPEEIRSIVDWVLTQNNNQTCPHGRPLTHKITKLELEKMFKRVVT
ncbi:DNA mismatch repair protein MutL [Clostridia bacterium]|nr:DNA mismatch repair protein MutL [Clostridia bacterium]